MRTGEGHSMKRTVRNLITLAMLLAAVVCIFPFKEPAYAAESVTKSVNFRNVDDKKDGTADKDTAAELLSPYNAFLDDYESFEVTSANLNDGVWDDIISNTAKGLNHSPQLEWTAVDSADLYVIIMDDPDAMDWMHWKSDHVTETRLEEGWASSSDYVGPYPPKGSTHTYEIYVVALKAPVERVKGAFNGQNPKFEKNFQALDIDVDGNRGNIIAVGRLSGTFTN